MGLQNRQWQLGQVDNQFLLTLINSFEASAMLTCKQRLTDLALE